MDKRKNAILALFEKQDTFAFAGFLDPLRKFGAKKYFTDHQAPNKTNRFGRFSFGL